MSREIDEKIVSMKLDNSNFEENARESMSTLDKLKEKLNFKNTDDGLDKVAKSAENANPAFAAMGNAVESVKLKLSALEVVGITALQNITNKAIDAGLSLAKSLSVDQISAGWDKYNQKTQAVQSIMSATGDSIEHVEEVLEKLNWYSDETSYSFTHMADTTSKFVNQNGDLEKSATAVMGISNALASAGVNASTANHAYVQLGQAISKALRIDDWRSMENISADTNKLKQTFIDTALEMGTLVKVGDKVYTLDKKLEVTTKNFRNTLEKDWATAEVQMAVWEKYGKYSDAIFEISDAYDTCAEAMEAFDKAGVSAEMQLSRQAFRDAQVAKTFAESVDATKDAVSSGWMNIFQTLFGNFNEASKLWTEMSMDLWDVFAGPLEKVNKLLKEAFDSPVDTFNKKLESAGVTSEQLEGALKKVGKSAGVDIDKLIDKYGSLDKVLQSGELNILASAEGNTNLLTLALRELADTATTSKSVTAEATKSLEDYKKVVHDVVQGEYGTGEARVKALTKAGWDYNTVQNAVNVAWDGSKLHLDRLNKEMFKLSDAELKSKGYTEEQIKALRELAKQAETAGSDIDKLIESLTRPSGRELLGKSITNIVKAINSWKDAVFGAFEEVFGEGMSEKIYKVVEAFEKFTEKLILSEESSEKLQNALSFVLKAGQTVTKTILSPLKTIGTIISTIASKLFETIKEVDGSKIFSNLTDWLKNVKEQMSDFAKNSDKVREKIQEWAKSVGQFKSFEDFRNGIKNLISQFPKLEEVINKVKNAFDKLKDVWDSIWNSKAIKSLRDTLSSAFDNVSSDLRTFFSGAGETISGIFEKVVSYISGLLKGDISFGNVISEIKELAPNVENVKSFFADWGEKLKTVKLTATDAFKTIFDWIGKVAAKIKENFDELGLSNLLGVLTGIATFLGAKSLFKIGGAVEEAGEKVGKGLGKAAGVLSELRDTLKSYQRELNASAFKEIAEALLMMAGAMWLIAQIPEDRFNKAAGTLGIMLTALVGINMLLGWVNKKLPLGTTGLNAKLDSSGLSASGSMSMMANMWLLSRAIMTMIKAFKMLTDAGIQDMSWKKIGKVLGVMAACITELGLVAIALGRLSTLTVPGSIATFIEALGIYAMMKLFKEIANFDPNIVLDNLGSFITIFSLLGIMFAETRLAAPNSLQSSFALIVLDVAVWLMGEVIEKLAKIPWDTFKEGAKRTLIIEGLLGFWEIIDTVVTVIRKLGKISGKTGTTSFLGLAAAIYSMAAAIDLLGGMEADKLEQGTKAVAAIMGLLSMVLTAAHEAKGAWASILALTAFLSVFTIAMSVLTALKDSQIRKMKTITNQIAKVFLALSVAMAATGLMGKWKVDKGPILSMMGLFAEVAIALGLLTVFVKDGNKFKAIATGITEVLLALGGAFALIGVGNKYGSTEHMGKIVAMISILTVIAGAIGTLITWLSTWKNVNLDQMKMLTEAIAILTPVVSGMGILMGLAAPVVGKGGAKSWNGFAIIFVSMITAMGAIFGAIEGIGYLFSRSEAATNNFIKFMEVIGTAFGAMKAAFNKAAGLTNDSKDGGISFPDLSKLGTQLTDFMNNAKGFFEGIESIASADDIAGKISTFTTMLKSVGWAELKTAVANWINSWGNNDEDQKVDAMESMANGIYLMGLAIGQANKSLTGIDEPRLNLISSAFSKFANISVDKDSGDNLIAYAPKLVEFMDYLVQINEKAAQIDDTSKLSAISLVIKKLADIGPGLDAIAHAQTLFDRHNWGSDVFEFFGEGLTDLVENLKTLAETGKDLDISDGGGLNKFCQALAQLIEATKTLPDTGGFLSVFKADNDPSTFAREMEDLVAAMNSMNSAGETLKVRNFRKIKEALELIQAISWPKSGNGSIGSIASAINPMNVLKDYTGQSEGGETALEKAKATVDDMTAFATFLGELANSIEKLNTVAEGISTDGITKIMQAVLSIMMIFSESGLKEYGLNFGFGDVDVDKFSSFMTTLGYLAPAMSELNSAGSSIDTDYIGQIAAGLKALVDNAPTDATKLSSVIALANQDGFTTFIGTLDELGENMELLSAWGANVNTTNIANVATGLLSIAGVLDGSIGGLDWGAITTLVQNDGFDTLVSKISTISNKLQKASKDGADISSTNIANVTAGLKEIASVFADSSVDWDTMISTLTNDSFVDALNNLGDGGKFGIGKGLAEVIEKVSEKGGNTNTENIKKVVDGLTTFAAMFNAEGVNWDNVKAEKLNGLDGALTAVMTSLDLLSGLGNTGIDDLTGITDALKEINKLAENAKTLSKNAGKGIGDNIISGITESLSGDSITEKINTIVFTIISQIEASTPQLSVAGDQFGAAIETGIVNRIASITSAGAQAAGGAVSGVLSKYADAISAGQRIDTGVAAGITRNKQQIATALNSAIDQAINAGKIKGFNGGQSVGAQIVKGIVSGINKNKSDISSALGTALTSELGPGSKVYNSAKTQGSGIGSQIIAGLKEGLTGVSGTFTLTLSTAVKDAVKKTESDMGIASPSKRTMWTGQMLGLGLVNGLLSETNAVTASSIKLGRSALDGLNRTLSSVDSSSIGLTPYTAKISPVMDLSKTRQGFATLSSDISSHAQTVSANVLTATKSKVSVEFENAEAIKNLSDKIDAIASNKTSEKYLATIAANSRKQIYMNGKTVVGELLPEIDTALGRKVAQHTRYNR